MISARGKPVQFELNVSILKGSGELGRMIPKQLEALTRHCKRQNHSITEIPEGTLEGVPNHSLGTSYT